MGRLIDADKIAEAIAWLNEYDFIIYRDVMKSIGKLPTVEVEPVRHGHWKESGTCSVCGKRAVKKVIFCDEMLWEDKYDYCPHCGAKMDEVGND